MTMQANLLMALMTGATMQEFHPQTHEQAYLAYALGMITDPAELPVPQTIEEALLMQYCLNGSGGLEITDATALFSNNYRIDQVGAIFPHIKNCTSYMNCFQNSNKLTEFHEKLNCAEGGADTTRMFSGCTALAGVIDLDHAPLRTQEYMFTNCSSLEGVLNVNLVGSTVYQFAMQGSASYIKPLRRFTFSPQTLGATNVNVSYCSFEREDAIEMFNSLPASRYGNTVTLTGNPCITGTRKDGTACDVLSEADKDIARNKNWTVVEA